MARKVLVTGAAGFIGSHLCERLVAAGDRVTGLDDFNDFYDPAFKHANLAQLSDKADFEVIEADVRDFDTVDRILGAQQPDMVVHLAARAGVRPSLEDPAGYARTNVDGTVNLLEAASRAEVPRVVFASSSSVYGNNRKVPFSEDDPVDHPISPYAATKRSGELLAHTFAHLKGMTVPCLRFFTVFGPRQRPDLAIYRFLSLVHRGETVPLHGDGTSSRDYTFIDDIVDGVTAVMDAQLEGAPVFNLGGSRPVTLSELLSAIEETAGRKAVIERLPDQPGDVRRTFADLRRSREELGYEPRITLVEGLQRQFEWMREQGRIG
ncbi:MAG: GDP-mannose 4,6-dehydratase [Deltaproteobacteria bacterium]|nr:GDP-mannose 4,6-dehydratase [Deltaproteobacteria bacterium]